MRPFIPKPTQDSSTKPIQDSDTKSLPLSDKELEAIFLASIREPQEVKVKYITIAFTDIPNNTDEPEEA